MIHKSKFMGACYKKNNSMKPEIRHVKFFNTIYEHHLWDQVKGDLDKISLKKLKTAELINKLQYFHFLTQTHRKPKTRSLRSEYTFKILAQVQHENILPDLFARMATLIMSFQAEPPLFPIFYSGTALTHTFTKKQVLLLMCMMAMSLLPEQGFQFTHKFPHFNDFKWIFSQDNWKTKCILTYLNIETKRQRQQETYNEKLTLRRLYHKETIDQAVEDCKNRPMLLPVVVSDQASIQDFYKDVKVDFANKYIGGGAFHSGCVQEEIMFVNHPEMYTSAVLCEVMSEKQAIEFIGYRKYFKNDGYGWTCAYAGFQDYKAMEYITAIDALHYPCENHITEYILSNINRELLKAYVGFDKVGDSNSRIVSGNWGCGAFKGNIALKFVIQWMASSMAGNVLVYVPFGSANKIKNPKLIQKICELNVGDLYKIITECADELSKKRDIFEVLQPKLGL